MKKLPCLCVPLLLLGAILGLNVFSAKMSFAAAANIQTPPEDARLPTIRIVFFTPKGVRPPANAQQRVNELAKFTEDFFVKWMTHWGYEPARKQMFQWQENGDVEILFATGDKPADEYTDGSFRPQVIQQLTKEHKIPRNNNINWVLVYKGDPPARFDFFKGSGNSKTGGWAMANFDSSPGEIRIDRDIAAGFHDDIALKGMIHEFGHALGLPHLGPRLKDDLGNTLMGPVNRIWLKELRAQGKYDARGYLSEGSAAMLWKHPIFTGTSRERGEMPKQVRLQKYSAEFDAQQMQIAVSGNVKSDRKIHSVLLVDDMDKKPGEYWVRPYVARVDAAGNFQVTVTEPVDSGGTYRLVFCLDNGVVTGDGKTHGLGSAIEKKYTYARGTFKFD